MQCVYGACGTFHFKFPQLFWSAMHTVMTATNLTYIRRAVRFVLATNSGLNDPKTRNSG